MWLLPVCGLLYASIVGLGFKFLPRQTQFAAAGAIRAGKRAARSGSSAGRRVVSVTLYAAVTSFLLVMCSGISLILAVWSESEFLFWLVFAISITPMVIAGLAMYAIAEGITEIGDVLEGTGEAVAKHKLAIVTIIPALLGVTAWIAGFGVKKLGSASKSLFQLLGLAAVSCYGLAAVVLLAKLFGNPERVANFQFLALSVALGVFAAMSNLLKLTTFNLFTWKRLSSFVMISFFIAIAQILFPQPTSALVKLTKNGFDHLSGGMGWTVARTTPGNDLYFRVVVQSGGAKSFQETTNGFEVVGLVPYGRHCLLGEEPQEVVSNGVKLVRGYCPSVMDPAAVLESKKHKSEWVWLPLSQTEVAQDPLQARKP